MRKLDRMLFREIKRSLGQIAAAVIVITMGVMMYTGINSTFLNLENTRDKYYESYNFEDLEVTGFNISEAGVEKVRSLPGVKMAASRLILSARLESGTDNPELRVVSLPGGEDKANDICITEGAFLDECSMNECILEKSFAEGNGYRVGDIITPVINGRRISLRVAGIGKSPEYVYIIKEPKNIMTDPKRFGIMYIGRPLAENLYGASGFLNDIAILLNPGFTPAEVKLKLNAVLKEYEGIKITERKDQLSNYMLREEINGLKSMGIEIPPVFFIVAAVITYIMMGRIIENKRVYIGILKSLGYKNSQILFHYMSYPVIIAAAGSILGSIIGFFLGMVFTNLENQYYGFPVLHYSFYMSFILPSVIITFAFCILAAFTACRHIFRISPSESMKPPAPKKGRRVLLERLPIFWKNLSFSNKMKIRSISRNRKRNFLTAIGIVLSTALLVIGFSCSDSLGELQKQIYDVEQNYDIRVSFKSPAGLDALSQIKSLEDVSHAEPLFEGYAEVKNGGSEKEVSLTALQDTSSLCRVLDEKGEVGKLPSNGILMPKRLADALGVKVGDYVDIKPYFPGGKSAKLKISGISSKYLGLGVDMNFKTLSSMLGREEIYTGAVIRLGSSGAQDINRIKNNLYKLPFVDSVEYRPEAKKNMEKSLKPFSLFSIAAILLAGVMSIAVIYNITVINIYEKKRELSSLKVMGFTKKEIRSSVFYENIVVGLVSLIAGLPAGRVLSKYILGYFYTTDAYSFPTTTYVPSYLYTALLIFLFIFSAQLLLGKRIDRIDMVEVLKVRE